VSYPETGFKPVLSLSGGYLEKLMEENRETIRDSLR
jgi:hypothetical protein